MPRHRLPYAIWRDIRRKVWLRDGGLCRGPYCAGAGPLPLDKVHIDHRHSGKLAGNRLEELRLLCRRCHVLRLDQRPRGLIGGALRDGLIPPDWRAFLWA